jgi:hypothetical protein
MVSNIVYRSHKALKIKAVKPFKLLAALVFVIALLAYQPEAVGFAFAGLYALSGPFEWALGWKKPTEDDDIFASAEDHAIMEPGHPDHDGYPGDHKDAQKDSMIRRLSLRGKPGDQT